MTNAPGSVWIRGRLRRGVGWRRASLRCVCAVRLGVGHGSAARWGGLWCGASVVVRNRCGCVGAATCCAVGAVYVPRRVSPFSGGSGGDSELRPSCRAKFRRGIVATSRRRNSGTSGFYPLFGCDRMSGTCPPRRRFGRFMIRRTARGEDVNKRGQKQACLHFAGSKHLKRSYKHEKSRTRIIACPAPLSEERSGRITPRLSPLRP